MTEPTDIDALIAEARKRVHTGLNPGGRQVYIADDEKRMSELADALESTAAELQKERGRADEAEAYASHALADRAEAQADLARAREVILQAVKLYDSDPPRKPGLALEMRQTIRPALGYLDKQNGADDDE